jgi:hypothetical protein
MATVIQLAPYQRPQRQTEAQAMEIIRRDLLNAGVKPDQMQAAMRRARESFRRQQSVGPALDAIFERARHDNSSSWALLDGFQAVVRELLAGRSPAVAIQAGYRALRPSRHLHSTDGPGVA